MSLTDKLMKIDAAKLAEKNTQEYEVKRLSELMGEPFTMTLQAIGAERWSDIQSDALTFHKGKVSGIDSYKLQVETIKAGVKEPNLKDKELLKHFGCATPNDLVNKLFLPAEIATIADKIGALCGYKDQDEVDNEVKN